MNPAADARSPDRARTWGGSAPNAHRGRRLWSGWVGTLCTLYCTTTTSWADPTVDLSSRAAEVAQRLRTTVLPYWFDTARDQEFGGFWLDDPPGGQREKMIVTQARMIWTFARVHRCEFSDERRNYLQAARDGYRFLVDRFEDRQYGGYYWTTDRQGRPTNERKMLYGQAFVVYAFVELSRAAQWAEPLDRALNLFRTIQARAHDAQYGGWTEHFERDWTPLPLRSPHGVPEVAGLKSANTHLHLMEAWTELYLATRDEQVRHALEESLRINRTYFYPAAPGRSCFHRWPNWSAVEDPRSRGLSYGHNVEFAWLMLEAERALNRPLSWDHFTAHLEHAWRWGWDPNHGGLCHRGENDSPATDRKKVWWVQAEWIAALSEAWRYRPGPELEQRLHLALDFVDRVLADPRDGVWWDSAEPDGRIARKSKAHNWKANYHDVRALLKFIDAVTNRPSNDAHSPL